MHGAATAIVVVAVLVATITPAGRGLSPFSFAFDLERRSASDAILNFLLFLPLGLTLAWGGRSAIAAGLFGFLLASIIEIAQTFLPGREPALSDIVFNALGAAGGALIMRWRRVLVAPDAKTSARLSVISLSLAASILIATGWLLAPIQGSGGIFIARSGEDVVLRYASRATAFGFDQPEYRREGVFGPRGSGESATVSASGDPSRWEVSIGTDRATLGPTVGQGWALLAYPDAIGRRWGTIVSGVWLLVIFLPVGIWARGRFLPVAATVSILLLAVLPTITGLAPTTGLEWLGAVTGFLAGAVLRVSRRSTPLSRAPAHID